jgi:hypothetical protein
MAYLREDDARQHPTELKERRKGRLAHSIQYEKATPTTTTIWNIPVILPRTSLGVISAT